MAGQLKIGGNVIATHAGAEGAGTVTLDSSTLTIGSNTTIQGQVQHSALPTGSVLKIHSASTTTRLNNFSADTYIDAISLTISNPVSSSSKFLIQNTAGGLVNNCSYIIVRVTRTIGATTDIVGSHISYHSLNQTWNGSIFPSISVQDEPSTTSAITYKLQVYATTSTSTVYWNYDGPSGVNHKSFLNVIEYQG